MADIQTNGAKVITLNSTNNYLLGDVGSRGGVKSIQIAAVSGTRSMVLKGRVMGSGGAWLAIPYTSLHLNGSAGTGAAVSTAITTDSLIQVVVADGVEVSLDNTHTSGSATATWSDSVGAA